MAIENNIPRAKRASFFQAVSISKPASAADANGFSKKIKKIISLGVVA
jgi:hypothetical protein